MYIDVLGYPSVSDAVHEASRMLRMGIAQAMAKGIENDNPTTENQDRQQTQTEPLQLKNPQPPPEKQPVSVYSTLTKRVRRPIPTVPEPPPPPPPPQESNTRQPDQPTSSITRNAFAPRSWSASKKAGPSILSKRNRAGLANGTANTPSGTPSSFQPRPKREKRSDIQSRDSTTAAPSRPVETKQLTRSAIATSQGSTKRLSSAPATKDDLHKYRTGENVKGKHPSTSSASLATPSNSTASASAALKNRRAVSAAAESPKTLQQDSNPRQTIPSPGPRKVGLPPSWYQVSAKSFKSGSATKPKSALSLLRKAGPSKPRSLPAAPRGSSVLSSVSAMRPTGTTTAEGSKVGRPAPVDAGLIPLPSSTGLRVKYVPGSEIIDGVRPNGYTISIDGVVKPVVTFNPKPKLPHKLRQNFVEKMFQGWRDVRKLAEGEALARALREEQEMYARAANRTDYRAAALAKLKDVRTVEK